MQLDGLGVVYLAVETLKLSTDAESWGAFDIGQDRNSHCPSFIVLRGWIDSPRASISM